MPGVSNAGNATVGVEMLSVVAPLMINNVIVNYEWFYSPYYIITSNRYVYLTRGMYNAYTCNV